MNLKTQKKEQSKEMEREREYRIGRNLKQMMGKGKELNYEFIEKKIDKNTKKVYKHLIAKEIITC